MIELLEFLNPFSSSSSSETFDGEHEVAMASEARVSIVASALDKLSISPINADDLIINAIPVKPKEFSQAKGLGHVAQASEPKIVAPAAPEVDTHDDVQKLLDEVYETPTISQEHRDILEGK